MAKFDEFVQKAKETAEVFADVSVELYKAAEEKAKVAAKKAKLSAEISAEKTAVKKLYLSIGANYYGLHKDNPESALEQACMEVTSALERIDFKRAELDSLKNKSKNDCDEDACCEECEDTAEDTVEDTEPEIEKSDETE